MLSDLTYDNMPDHFSQKKAQTWALQNWVEQARRRTQAFYRNGPQGPVTWILVEDGRIPEGAIVGGEEEGQPQYICRAFFEACHPFNAID